MQVSPDGLCGAATAAGTDVTCAGSRFGGCCSAAGFCGSTAAYCLEGCQAAFGKCGTTAVGAAPPAGHDDGLVDPTTDGSCGNGVTCLGAAFGNCCSEHGW